MYCVASTRRDTGCSVATRVVGSYVTDAGTRALVEVLRSWNVVVETLAVWTASLNWMVTFVRVDTAVAPDDGARA